MFLLEEVTGGFDIVSQFTTLLGSIDFDQLPLLFLAIVGVTIGPSLIMAIAKKGQGWIKAAINKM